MIGGLGTGEHEYTVAAMNLAGTGPAADARDVDLLRGNAARWPGSTVTSSSQYDVWHAAANVRDGGAGEWASAGEQDPWVRLEWEQPVRVDRIVLRDRPGVDDVNAGTLSFSDGTTVAVADVPPDGAEKTVGFPMRAFRWVRFDVRGGTGPNVGLAELEVHAVPSAPLAPVDVAAVADGGNVTVTWTPPAFDGGARVTAYAVTPYRDGEPQEPLIVDGDRTRVVVPGLTTGRAHRFTVAARNLTGAGAESVPSEPVVP